jgi:hypothetical protein
MFALPKKRIDGEFAVLEIEVAVMCSPYPEAMAVTYITMLAEPTKEHYRAILKLRGPMSGNRRFSRNMIAN